jgi:hypothetical protein
MNNRIIIALAIISSVWACKPKDDEPSLNTSVKTTYDFANVDYSESDTLLKRGVDLSTITDKAKTATATGLEDIYKNLNSKYPESYSLYSKTNANSRDTIWVLLDSIETRQTLNAASEGMSGIVTTGTLKYLVDKNGYEYRQVALKLMMGTTWYHQIKTLFDNDASLDNTTVIDGKGTAMEHNWDLAFSLWGVPKDFPTNTIGTKNLGNYTDKVNSMINASSTIMNAFITGRQAISNKDMVTKNAQKAIILTQLEKVLAASVIYELNESKTYFSDQAKMLHYVSEAYGFVLALDKVGTSQLSSTDYKTIYSNFGSSLYQISLQNIDAIINIIKQRYSIQ